MLMILHGAPRTKKNHGRTVRVRGRPVHLPSEAHEAWKARALYQARTWLYNLRDKPKLFACPIAFPVNVCAMFYRDALRGDAVGYYQALADLLQAARIVDDDKWIVSWDGSRLAKDAKQPRIELWITAAKGDRE